VAAAACSSSGSSSPKTTTLSSVDVCAALPTPEVDATGAGPRRSTPTEPDIDITGEPSCEYTTVDTGLTFTWTLGTYQAERFAAALQTLVARPGCSEPESYDPGTYRSDEVHIVSCDGQRDRYLLARRGTWAVMIHDLARADRTVYLGDAERMFDVVGAIGSTNS
jgi:hypothetical protein